MQSRAIVRRMYETLCLKNITNEQCNSWRCKGSLQNTNSYRYKSRAITVYPRIDETDSNTTVNVSQERLREGNQESGKKTRSPVPRGLRNPY